VANFLQQVPTLVGVIFGALATILATTYAERSQWKRNQAVRWDAKRLEAYAQYAETIRNLHLIATRLSVPMRPGARSQPLDPAVGEELISEGEAARARAWEAVLMLGDAEAVVAGRQWRAAVLRMELFAQRKLDQPVPWSELDEEADRARHEYYAATRRSLGVLGDAPQPKVPVTRP
jgi:hypothetical protein